MKRRAVFMDRDGTISEEVGYINHPSRFRLFPYAKRAIKLLNDNGWLAVVITNQAGVARGYFPEAMIETVHQNFEEELRNEGARVDGIYYCAHHPTIGEPPYRQDCDCRKPKPGLITRAAKDLDIQLEQSWMIGDRYSDIELAHNAGVRAALVLSGYGRGEWENQRDEWKYHPDLIADDLLNAVASITGKPNASTS
jgi:D-glycero-D-manno-heptose 1,7-bisphosphate phosphatase